MENKNETQNICFMSNYASSMLYDSYSGTNKLLTNYKRGENSIREIYFHDIGDINVKLEIFANRLNRYSKTTFLVTEKINGKDVRLISSTFNSLCRDIISTKDIYMMILETLDYFKKNIPDGKVLITNWSKEESSKEPKYIEKKEIISSLQKVVQSSRKILTKEVSIVKSSFSKEVLYEIANIRDETRTPFPVGRALEFILDNFI